MLDILFQSSYQMASKPRIHELDDLRKHNQREDCWIVIHGKVYNVTDFLSEHPGGVEVLLSATERDASEDFEEAGHGKQARELMKKYYIGDIDPNTLPSGRKYNPSPVYHVKKAEQYNPLFIKLILPLLIFAIAAFAAINALKQD
ncbi:Cytochrome b5 isoform B [Linum grandiflorum]